MRPNANHVQSALLRAITAQAGLVANNRQKAILIVEQIISSDWASATFLGATHDFALRLDGDPLVVNAAVAALHDGLAERDIPVAGHIVAEIAVRSDPVVCINNSMVSISLTVNALTIID
nr:hypothetical protein [Polymorphobacter sp.]